MDLLLCDIIQHPVETYGYAVIFSITGYLGINIVLTLVTTFGALPAVTSEYVEEARVTLCIRFTSDKWTGFFFFAVESSVDGPGRWITLHRFSGMESGSLKVQYNELCLHFNSLYEVRAIMFKF